MAIHHPTMAVASSSSMLRGQSLGLGSGKGIRKGLGLGLRFSRPRVVAVPHATLSASFPKKNRNKNSNSDRSSLESGIGSLDEDWVFDPLKLGENQTFEFSKKWDDLINGVLLQAMGDKSASNKNTTNPVRGAVVTMGKVHGAYIDRQTKKFSIQNLGDSKHISSMVSLCLPQSCMESFVGVHETVFAPMYSSTVVLGSANTAIEDSSIDVRDFFKGQLPEKLLKLLAWLALSRVGTYIPLAGVNTAAFQGSLDQNSLLGTLDSFSGGGIGRLGICSLGIVPFINAQIVFQLLGTVFPNIQQLQKKEGEAGRKKILQWTRYASVGFAVLQAVGQLLYIRPYVYDFSAEWFVSSVAVLTLGSLITLFISERITKLNLGNGTSFLIFTNIVSYLPASIGRTIAEALKDGNFSGLAVIVISFFLLVLGIVYVQEAERKIPLNYASRFGVGARGLQKSAYLPFKVNSSGVMPIIFSTSSLALPGTIARFTGLAALKNAAIALYPGGALYIPSNVMLIAFFNYFYTFLQLDPDELSEQLKRQGASIPSIRPGKSTANYVRTVLSRISVLGSLFLGIMAATPAVVEGVTHLTAFRGFAGTSVLILVGCATDTARKVQAEIISQKYQSIDFYNLDNKD